MTSETIYNKNLPKIILLCFFAPIFFTNIWLAEMFLIDKAMGFTPIRVTHHCISGCYTENWMQPVSFFSMLTLNIALALIAFAISRKGVRNGSIIFLLTGAFLFHPAALSVYYRVKNLILTTPLKFLEFKDDLSEEHLPVFGNLYNFRWTNLITYYLEGMFFLFLAYQIFFRHWDKTMRIQFFTYGLLFAVAGRIFWNYLLGPALYNFPFSEIFMR